MKSHKTIVVPCVLTALAGMVTLTGCDQRSDDTKAVQSASDTLHAIGVYPASGTDKYESRLKEVASNVSSVATSGTNAEKATAALLTSQTLRGQGEIAAAKAKSIELDIRNRLMIADSRLSDYSRLSASAAALRTFDPAKDIAELTSSKSAREAELTDLSSKVTEARARVESFSREAQQRLAAAEVAATEYATIMATTTSMSATQAVDVVKRANEVRRRADAMRTEAGKIQAQADLAKPVADELVLLESKTKNQIASFVSTISSLHSRKQDSQAQADALASAANVAANDADKVVQEVVALRTSDLAPAYDAAIAAMTKAVSQANAANESSVSGSRIAKASAQLSVAETQWARAGGAANVAILLERLAAATPALPGKSEYEKQAAAAREEAKTARAVVETSLLDAQGTFESVKVADAATKARIEQVAAQLAKLKDTASGAAIVPAVETTPQPEAAPAENAAATVDPAISQAMTGLLNNAREGKVTELLAVLHSDGPKTKAAIESLVAANAATNAKFNKNLLQMFEASPEYAPMIAQTKAQIAATAPAEIKVEDSQITMIADDKASVQMPGQAMPSMLVKRDGVWKQDISMLEMMLGAVPGVAGVVEKVPGLLNTWAADVTSGKFADEAAAVKGLTDALTPLMAEIAPKPPTGG